MWGRAPDGTQWNPGERYGTRWQLVSVVEQCSRNLGGGGGLRSRNSKLPRRENQKGSHSARWDPNFSRLMHPLVDTRNLNGTEATLSQLVLCGNVRREVTNDRPTLVAVFTR